MVIREEILVDGTTVKAQEIEPKTGQENDRAELAIYVSAHCAVCAYAYEVAEDIRERFPEVELRLVDIQTTSEPIPEAVFATPTYLLNGRVWSLGNPSPALVTETFE